MNNFWVSLVIGHEYMSHVMCHDVSLAHECLTVVMFVFYGSHHEFRVHILSLDTIGHGMTWQRIRL